MPGIGDAQTGEWEVPFEMFSFTFCLQKTIDFLMLGKVLYMLILFWRCVSIFLFEIEGA